MSAELPRRTGSANDRDMVASSASTPRIAIVGGGIGGLAAAAFLHRAGLRSVVYEQAPELKEVGAGLVLAPNAVRLLHRLGAMDRLRHRAVPLDVGWEFRRWEDGRVLSAENLAASCERLYGERTYTVHRADLQVAIGSAVPPDALQLGKRCTSVTVHGDTAVLEFADGSCIEADVVIGADGVHSTVRSLAFGPESGFVSHMGLYVATVSLEGFPVREQEVVMYNTPGRAVAIHPSRGRALAAFMFRSPARDAFDHRETGQHRAFLAEAFAGAGWRVPELLDRVQSAADLYFDSVSRVRVPAWCRGRVALVGDATSGVSLFGDGSSLAMAGAYTLAEELAARGGDHSLAFRRYEARHRKLTDPIQKYAARVGALLVPATRCGIDTRNLATRLWPLGAAAAWLGRFTVSSAQLGSPRT
jgi:2-polyprenyl-6-methoxyphenol hydroxylase-like FAD-dependent oxidoreductase